MRALEKIFNLLKDLSTEDEYFKEKKKLLNYFLNLIHDSVNMEEYLIKSENEEVVIWAIEEGFDVDSKKGEEGWMCRLPEEF